jgi:hypothetical protein
MAVLTILTERDGVGVLGMSSVHIPTVSSALYPVGSKLYLVPSDKHLNNYKTDSFHILSHSPFIIRTTFRAITTFSDSVDKQKPEKSTTHGHCIKTWGRTRHLQGSQNWHKCNKWNYAVFLSQTLNNWQSHLKTSFLWTASICAILQRHTVIFCRRQLDLKKGISENRTSSFHSENCLKPHTSKSVFTAVTHSQYTHNTLTTHSKYTHNTLTIIRVCFINT